MTFEILKNNCIVFLTTHKDCLPSRKEWLTMKQAGYKFKIDGVIASTKKIEELLKK